MPRFCDKCGAKLEPNENFCSSCGTKIIRDESPPDKPTSPKSESTSPSIKIVCIGLAAVTAILIFGILVYRNDFDRDISHKPASVEQAKTQSATVPDVVGKTQSEAAAALKVIGVEARFTDAYSDSVPAGKIISQSPNSGAKISSGQTVYVYVSKGVDPSKASASFTEADLTIAGLTLGMSRQAVENIYHEPTIRSDDYFKYDNVEVGFTNGVVTTVACTGGSPTSRGIHVGSTLADVENAYGKNYSRDKDASGDIYTYNFGDSALRFDFDTQNGKVTRIAVYRATKKTPSITEADLTVAGLTLEMSRQAVEQRLGAPTSQDGNFFHYGNITVEYENNAVRFVTYTGTSATPRGIRVGDSLGQVENAYGKNYSSGQQNDGTLYSYQLEKARLNFVINDAGRVDRITFYRNFDYSSAATPTKPASDGYNYSCTVGGTTTYKGIKRNGIACALYDWQTQKRISSEYMSKTAQGTFYIVTAIVGNGTNAPIVYPTLYLVDERDRKYSSNNDATSIYGAIHNVEVELELNPGQPQFVCEVYDIPDGVTITGLRCEAFTANFDTVEFSMPLRVVTE